MFRQAIRSRLSSVSAVRRTAWSLGHALHHTVPTAAGVRRPGRSPPSLGEGRWSAPRPSAPLSDDAERLPPRLPLSPRPLPGVQNPILTGGDVSDFGAANYVADPFLHIDGDDWHLFFEVYNHGHDPDSAIAHATSDDYGATWEYDRVVLETDGHISFPYLFQWGEDYYMVPEEGGTTGTRVHLYEATSFPTGWERTELLVDAAHRVDDPIVFRWNDRWWLLVGDSGPENRIFAYYSDELSASGWQPHAGNPVVRDRPEAVRPAGRPVVTDGRLVVFFQDCRDRYGDRVRAFEIDDLSPTTYADRELPESPVLGGTGGAVGWNSGNMHHIDPWYVGDRWICAVDGNVELGRGVFTKQQWSIGLYCAP